MARLTHTLLAFVDGSSHTLEVPIDRPLVIGGGDADDWCPGVGAPDAIATIALNGPDLVIQTQTTEESWVPRVNGVASHGFVRIYSSDILTIGSAQLIYHGPRRVSPGGTVVAATDFRPRLCQETERCTRSRSTLSLVILRYDAAADALDDDLLHTLRANLRQVDLISLLAPGEMAVLMPETDARASIPAERIVARLRPYLPGMRAGYACCPRDASDPDALLAGARQAAAEAGPGEVRALQQNPGLLHAGPYQLVAVEPTMRKVMDLVRRLAPTTLPVLIVGETGVGKEYIAQALHHWSPRRSNRLVSINCAAVAESLFESELFGHERGAFTGATETKPGLLEAASGGTVLLDEIGECPPAVQAKLLRAIETRRVSRVGSVEEREVDIRILAATNRDLARAVAEGRFRADLFYRLNAGMVTVPPLSHRPLDIPVLARMLLQDACRRVNRTGMRVTDEALRRLVLHDWPGNVRELRNVLDLCAATSEGETLDAGDLPPDIAARTAPWLAGGRTDGPRNAGPAEFADRPYATLKEELESLERTRILQALEATGGVRNRAAELLGVPLRTFVSRLKKYGINRPDQAER